MVKSNVWVRGRAVYAIFIASTTSPLGDSDGDEAMAEVRGSVVVIGLIG